MLDDFLASITRCSTWLVPLALVLVVAAGGLTARAGRPAVIAGLTTPPPATPPAAPAPDLMPTAEGQAALVVPSPTAAEPPAASPTVLPTSTPVPPRRRPTPTPDPNQWRGRALTDAIIRVEPQTKSRPAGLLLKDELADVEAEVQGEEVEPGNTTWYWVRSGVMEGFVYSTLFEPGPRPG